MTLDPERFPRLAAMRNKRPDYRQRARELSENRRAEEERLSQMSDSIQNSDDVFDEAWALVKVDVDYQFGLTMQNQAGDEVPVGGGYNFKDKNIKLNPGRVYQSLKEQLERAGIDREPTDQEIINGITNISIHEGVHAADHQLHGKKWLETPLHDKEMNAHMLQMPLLPHSRMQAMRRHPGFDDFGDKNKQYIEDYLRDVSDDSEGLSRTFRRNIDRQKEAGQSVDDIFGRAGF